MSKRQMKTKRKEQRPRMEKMYNVNQTQSVSFISPRALERGKHLDCYIAQKGQKCCYIIWQIQMVCRDYTKFTVFRVKVSL
jgi:hypothetical protein